MLESFFFFFSNKDNLELISHTAHGEYDVTTTQRQTGYSGASFEIKGLEFVECVTAKHSPNSHRQTNSYEHSVLCRLQMHTSEDFTAGFIFFTRFVKLNIY